MRVWWLNRTDRTDPIEPVGRTGELDVEIDRPGKLVDRTVSRVGGSDGSWDGLWKCVDTACVLSWYLEEMRVAAVEAVRWRLDDDGRPVEDGRRVRLLRLDGCGGESGGSCVGGCCWGGCS